MGVTDETVGVPSAVSEPVVPVIWVSVIVVPVSDTPSIVTEVAPVRLEPVMVTNWPPVSGPELGLIDDTLGEAACAPDAIIIASAAMAKHATRMKRSPVLMRRAPLLERQR